MNVPEECRVRYRTLFPDWPILTPEDLENRDPDLKKRDTAQVTCVGRRINHLIGKKGKDEGWYSGNPGTKRVKRKGKERKDKRRNKGQGFIYQFEWFAYGSTGIAHPSNLCEPDESGYWTKDGFRGCYFFKLSYAYVEVPDPEAWMSITGRSYNFAYVDGPLTDLQYAKLSAYHDFVVARDKEFYHDMMYHIGLVKRDKYCRKSLMRAISFYENIWIPKEGQSKGLEYALGYCADVNISFSRALINGFYGQMMNNKYLEYPREYIIFFGRFFNAFERFDPPDPLDLLEGQVIVF